MTSVQSILTTLRQRGERMTIQRRMVIEALCAGKGHQTTLDIRRYLQNHDEDITESTIYRILRWLNALGLVSQTDLGLQGIVYELMAENPHHHLVCLSCGKIIPLADSFAESIRQSLRDEYAFEPRVEHL